MAPHDDALDPPAAIDRDNEKPQPSDVSRRDFLKTVGASGVATTIVAQGVPVDGQAAPAQAPRRPAAGNQAVDPRPYMRIRQEVAENLMKRGIVGYADRLRVQPGETIKFMVSSEQPRYRADIVRLIHGDANPKGPGIKEVVVETPGQCRVSRASTRICRSDRTRSSPIISALRISGSFTFTAWIAPTSQRGIVERFLCRLRRRADQMGGAERGGYGVFIDEDGRLALWIDRCGRPHRETLRGSRRCGRGCPPSPA